MVASSGDALSGAGFVEAIAGALLPLVDCLTPNLAEAAALLGEPTARSEEDMARQGEALLKLGPRAVLMKGGHLDGDEAVDLLVTEDGVHRFAAPRLASHNLHGTGCTLSSAIAANVVLGARLAGSRGCGQGVRSRSDRARPGCRVGRGSRAADPDRAAFETLKRPVRIYVSLGLLARRIGRTWPTTSMRPFRSSTTSPTR